MNEPTDLDIRIAALQQEYQQQIAALCSRGGVLAAELASAQAKLKALETEKQNAKPDLHSVGNTG